MDYISRDGALRKFIEGDGHDDDRFTEGYNFAVQEYREEVKKMPAADVQSVRHGRWECVGHDDKTYWYRCSVCGHEEHDNMTKHDNYCGSCGARMDAEPDEPWQSE